MIHFITVAMLYLALMFVVFFCLSFITIGIAVTFAGCIKRCVHVFRQPHLLLK